MLGAAWLLVVSPERKKAAKLSTQVSAASAQLATAQGQVANARTAQTQYATAYASIVRLGKAVPPTQEVPSLIYQIAQATNDRNVEFSSITASRDGRLEHLGSECRGGARRVRVGLIGSQRLQSDALHLRLQRKLLGPLPPVRAARQLDRAYSQRPPCGQRPPADDPEREAVPVDHLDRKELRQERH